MTVPNSGFYQLVERAAVDGQRVTRASVLGYSGVPLEAAATARTRTRNTGWHAAMIMLWVQISQSVQLRRGVQGQWEYVYGYGELC